MLSGARASALLPCFQEARLPGAGVRGFHASMLSGLQVSGHPPCFSPLLSGDHAARLSGFFLASRPAFMLSGAPASMLSGGHASPRLPPCFQGARLPVVRGPDFQLSGDHVAMLSGGKAFMLSGGHASILSGGFPVARIRPASRGPGPGIRRPGARGQTSSLHAFRGPGTGGRGPDLFGIFSGAASRVGNQPTACINIHIFRI